MDLKILTISKNSIDNSVLTNKDIAKNQLEQIVVSMPSPLGILLLTRLSTNESQGILFSSILFAYSNAAGLAFSINAGLH
jgi:hypothetical protein